MPGARVERAFPAFQTGASTASAILANLVEEEGVEPPSTGCRPAVLPLNDSPNTSKWLRAGELNATRMAYEASMTPVHLPASVRVSSRLGASAENRTPFVGQAIRCPANGPHPLKTLERTEIIEISSLGWRPRAHPIYHARIKLVFNCQRPC